MEPHRWVIGSPEAMQRFGALFAETLSGGEVMLLDGPLGAGKTQFIKGLGEGLGVPTVINSPTFNIVKSHQGRLALHHIDLYRLDSEPEIADLGLEDLQSQDAVLAVEWAERYPPLMTEPWNRVALAMGDADMQRVLTLESSSSLDESLLGNLLALAEVATA